jgi:murein L,D-transpeptidase YafK
LINEGFGTAFWSGGFVLNCRPLLRSLVASAAIAAALALAGCDTDGTVPTARSLQPISPAMLAEIDQKNMSKESPILVRLFKEEAELEVWKEDKTGRYALLKTYPICRWSGELGPKIKAGDRQAPEGFYTITPGLMNPNSNYYLAINTGFPNSYDRANGRTGSFLMIHGDCSSAGCYAMTDEQISEIYALARESFFGGQRAFQIQAYPFRMTPLNMAKHRNSPHMAFWKMLKQGYDHFEVSRLEPKVDVCEKRYVFDAEAKGAFSPAARCPAYQVNEDLIAAVTEKQQRDEKQFAELVSRGTPTVAVKTGSDGGMHPTFLAAVQPYNVDSDRVVRARVAAAPGTIPANIRLPGERPPEQATGSLAIAEPMVPRTTMVASADQSGSSGWFGSLFSSSDSKSSSSSVVDRVSRAVGLRGSEPTKETKGSKAKAAVAKPTQTASAARPKQAEPKQAELQTPANPAIRPKPQMQEANASPTPPGSVGLMSGAQPTVPTGTFEGRFGAWR